MPDKGHKPLEQARPRTSTTAVETVWLSECQQPLNLNVGWLGTACAIHSTIETLLRRNGPGSHSVHRVPVHEAPA